MNRRPRQKYRAGCEQLEDRRLLSVLTPAQVRQAYGMDAINFTANGQTIGGSGTGQTMAVIGAFHNLFLTTELSTFDARFGLPDPALTQVNLAGARTDTGWAEEEAMDVEWCHVMAPGASIIAVEAASDSTSDMMNAVNLARQLPGVSVVTMSWGGGEFRGQGNYNSFFTTPAGHNGVTFVTASGDYGSKYGANWPATSPNVVAVGGTTLSVDAMGNILSETAWAGSGGGLSARTARPGYQAGIQRSGRRSNPDVSMVADPSTGVPVLVMTPSTGQAYWGIYGGTSLSTQLFGGLVAVANQGRALAGLGTLDGPTQTLPLLYSVSSADYRDVTAGSNGYRATRGYDLATGLGSPWGPSLVSDLTNPNIQATLRSLPSRIRGRTSARSVARLRLAAPPMHVTINRLTVATDADSRFLVAARFGSAVESRFHHALSRQPG